MIFFGPALLIMRRGSRQFGCHFGPGFITLVIHISHLAVQPDHSFAIGISIGFVVLPGNDDLVLFIDEAVLLFTGDSHHAFIEVTYPVIADRDNKLSFYINKAELLILPTQAIPSRKGPTFS